MNKTISAPS